MKRADKMSAVVSFCVFQLNVSVHNFSVSLWLLLKDVILTFFVTVTDQLITSFTYTQMQVMVVDEDTSSNTDNQAIIQAINPISVLSCQDKGHFISYLKCCTSKIQLTLYTQLEVMKHKLSWCFKCIAEEHHILWSLLSINKDHKVKWTCFFEKSLILL